MEERIWHQHYDYNVQTSYRFPRIPVQGFESDGDITPVYDTQQAVYMAVLADLEQANTLLGSTRA